MEDTVDIWFDIKPKRRVEVVWFAQLWTNPASPEFKKRYGPFKSEEEAQKFASQWMRRFDLFRARGTRPQEPQMHFEGEW